MGSIPDAADVRIATHLVLQDFRVKYRRSIIGWLWSLAQPLSRLLIIGFIFTRAIPLDIENYPAFLFVGLVSWGWFASGVSTATTSLVDQRALLLRPGFHRGTVPVVAVLSSMLDSLAGFLVLITYVSITIGPTWAIVMLPYFLILQFFLITGFGLLFCVANVYLRDVKLFVDLCLQLGFYLTPIFYRPDLLPEELQGLFAINPMSQMLEALRSVLIDGVFPSLGLTLYLTVVCAAVFACGAVVFNSTSHSVIDEL